MKENRKLPVALTEQEWNERAEELAQICEEIDRDEEAKKELVAEFKRTIDGKNFKRTSLQMQVRDHKEYREISCEWQADYAHQTMILYREDTGDEVTRRTMTSDELQAELPLDR
jgi:hypothetical protein